MFLATSQQIFFVKLFKMLEQDFKKMHSIVVAYVEVWIVFHFILKFQ